MSSIATKIDLIKQYLDVRLAEHNLHSANVANVETPHYKAKIGSFESTLKQQSGLQENEGLLGAPSEAKWNLGLKVNQSKATSREDGNNVQLEKEMAGMAGNSILFMTAIKILSKEMAIERYAINGNR